MSLVKWPPCAECAQPWPEHGIDCSAYIIRAAMWCAPSQTVSDLERQRLMDGKPLTRERAEQVLDPPCPGCGTPGCDMPSCATCACGGTAGENDHVDGCPNGGEPS